MLTSSDWFLEMRSNRYHYATRFARTHPVYFVQPDLLHGSVEIERLPDRPNISIVHVPSAQRNILFTPVQQFLDSLGPCTPLLWCYDYRFDPVYCHADHAVRAYHATEDYFRMIGPRIPQLARTVAVSDLIVCVSEGVRASLEEHLGPLPQAHVVTNGCDFAFYTAAQSGSPLLHGIPIPRALYQGNLSGKVDMDLICRAAKALPTVAFVLAGDVVANSPGRTLDLAEWNRVLALPNVYYLGKLSPDRLPAIVQACDVGLIPFVQEDWNTKSLFPLKAFEYLAAGLPVVSTPLDNLAPFKDIIHFASTPQDFIRGIHQALCGNSQAHVERRRAAARAQDYDLKFARVRELLCQCGANHGGTRKSAGRGKHVFWLVASEPSLETAVDTDGASETAVAHTTVIGLETRPEADRVELLLERHPSRTLIRRPLVQPSWRDCLEYAHEVAGWSPKRWGLTWAGLLAGMAVARALVTTARRLGGLLPVCWRSAIKRALPRSGDLHPRDRLTGHGNCRGASRLQIGLVYLTHVTRTLLQAVQETMVKPDAVRCRDLYSLLAGVVCKRRFGCQLLYDAGGRQLPHDLERKRIAGWLFSGLERCVVSHGDRATMIPPIDALETRRAENPASVPSPGKK